MPAERLQRELLSERAFIAQLRRALRTLNELFATSFTLDEQRGRRAHRSSRGELEILVGSRSEDELYEAFDAFIDILIENLIIERAFADLSPQSGIPRRAESTIRSVLKESGVVLVPIMVMDAWFRSSIFELTGRAIPSFFEESNVELIAELCQRIGADTSEARNWRRHLGYPPLDQDSD